ncbi:hypothetical protein GEV33_010885 [Tenebrio molitor]|uniref:Uncharacterized protein n=1 Tax=Tenebrio molitor TaxID=7067 RepID=A0A8J6HDW6_TENMO|nr:hypothetical protein GEV33_010885 [Tenebrio molitor]
MSNRQTGISHFKLSVFANRHRLPALGHAAVLCAQFSKIGVSSQKRKRVFFSDTHRRRQVNDHRIQKANPME